MGGSEGIAGVIHVVLDMLLLANNVSVAGMVWYIKPQGQVTLQFDRLTRIRDKVS